MRNPKPYTNQPSGTDARRHPNTAALVEEAAVQIQTSSPIATTRATTSIQR